MTSVWTLGRRKVGPMRTTLCLAIGLAAVFAISPAGFAQEPRTLAESGSARSGDQADQHQRRVRVEPQEHASVFVEVPTGKVSVGPEFVDGAPVYERRTKPTAGIAIVEFSTAPLTFDLSPNQQYTVRPDQPTGW